MTEKGTQVPSRGTAYIHSVIKKSINALQTFTLIIDIRYCIIMVVYVPHMECLVCAYTLSYTEIAYLDIYMRILK